MDRKSMTTATDLSSRVVSEGHATRGLARARSLSEGAPATLGVGSRPMTASGSSDRSSLDFEQVYEAHFDFVWRSLRLLGVRDEALEDAAQDTFSVVSRQLPRFEGRSALRTWLFAILQRVAANHRRRRRRKQQPLTPLSDAAGDEPTPLAHAEAAEAARVVERFCDALEPDRRALFVLAVIEDLPAAEVAEALGVPITKVYSRVHALREGLKRVLAERGGDDGCAG
jgi:RNA polymerase sigma-70 factor (ECF subfamily)